MSLDRLPAESCWNDCQYGAGPPSAGALGVAEESPLDGVHASVMRRRRSDLEDWVSPDVRSAILLTLPASSYLYRTSATSVAPVALVVQICESRRVSVSYLRTASARAPALLRRWIAPTSQKLVSSVPGVFASGLATRVPPSV